MRGQQTSRRHLLIVLCSSLAMAVFSGCSTPMVHPKIESAWRVGPFIERQTTHEGETLLAVRPFYSREANATNAPVRRVESDYLWPIGHSVSKNERYSWRFLLFYGSGGDADKPVAEEDEPYRFRLFPIYFSGRTREGEDYRAVFPLGGTIRGFLLSDEFEFYLFPFYGRGRRAGVEMQTICWPFYLTRHGEHLDQFRLWPFYGNRIRRGRHQTDEASFTLWPFWTSTATHGDSVNGSGYLLFPIYGHSSFERTHRGKFESWSVIPPLFTYAKGDDGYRKLHAPWPIIRQLDKEDLHARHVWPLYGSVTNSNSSRTYALWPLFSVHSASNQSYSVSVQHFPAPIYYHITETRLGDSTGTSTNNPRTSVSRTYTRVWPLFSYRETEHGSFSRFPELSLWSTSVQVERNLAPLWSLYTRRHRVLDDRTGHDVLWGLFSREYGPDYSATTVWPFYSRKRDGDHWRWNILGGLIGKSGTGNRSSWRFLWFFGGDPDDESQPIQKPKIEQPSNETDL